MILFVSGGDHVNIRHVPSRGRPSSVVDWVRYNKEMAGTRRQPNKRVILYGPPDPELRNKNVRRRPMSVDFGEMRRGQFSNERRNVSMKPADQMMSLLIQKDS